MTAVRARRTRATVIAFAAALVALAAVAGLSVAGLQTLADSTAGQNAADDDQPVLAQRLPYTATALLGVADEDGRLTGLVVGALEPDGTGGSLVQVPVSADPSSGNADQLAPLDAILEVGGPIAFREAAERLTNLSFDVIEIVDRDRFVELVTPLGDLRAAVPFDVIDTSSDETWEAGEVVLTAPGAARLVMATDPARPAWSFEPVRAAVWQAVAGRVGAGIGSATPVAVDTDVPPPGSVDEFLDRLFAGPVAFRQLQYAVVEDDDLAEQLGPAYAGAFGDDTVESVVLLDRAEMLMVFGGVAPSRLGAPLDAPSFRITSGLTDADTEPMGGAPADVVKTVVNVLMFTQVNVVSVNDLGNGDVPDVTQVRVSDPTLLDDVGELYEPHFGELEVLLVDVGIDGIDAEIVLGRSLVDRLASDTAADVAGSDDGDTTPNDTTPNDTTPDDTTPDDTTPNDTTGDDADSE